MPGISLADNPIPHRRSIVEQNVTSTTLRSQPCRRINAKRHAVADIHQVPHEDRRRHARAQQDGRRAGSRQHRAVGRTEILNQDAPSRGREDGSARPCAADWAPPPGPRCAGHPRPAPGEHARSRRHRPPRRRRRSTGSAWPAPVVAHRRTLPSGAASRSGTRGSRAGWRDPGGRSRLVREAPQ